LKRFISSKVSLGLVLAACCSLGMASNAFATALAGDTNVESYGDTVSGIGEAFGYQATASGTAKSISVYLTSHVGATVGLYATPICGETPCGYPGALLDSGSVSTNKAGWVKVPLSGGGISVNQYTRYWIDLAPNSGSSTTGFKDAGFNQGGSTLDWTSLSYTLDSPFAKDDQFDSAPASAYVSDQ
jgi:hypothetical protein